MELKAGADGVLAAIDGLSRLTPSGQALIGIAIAIGLVALVFFSGFGARLRAVLYEMMFKNWQLGLLGAAALILSLAGGYTTWDGMRNFTGEPVLSLMFTFGIHGVMLIVAWLIGESFATGMNLTPTRHGAGTISPPIAALTLIGVLLLAIALAVYGSTKGISDDDMIVVLGSVGALFIAIAFFTIFARTDVVAPYVQALRLIAKNAVLWVMFLACMATSVFFSFDSRFNVVFPEDERKRVADLRAQNQVTGILADIEQTMTGRRIEQASALFKSEGWQTYDANLTRLATAAQGAQGEIERYFVQQMEDRRRAVAQQQERMTTAQSGQTGLASRKISLTEEVARIKADRPALVAEYAQHKAELDAKSRAVDEKRVEALAEDRGVEGTGKQGRGPAYRERMTELARLQDEFKIKDERTRDAQKRLGTVESRIAQVERELATIDGDIAKLRGEADTAAQRIRTVQEQASATDGPKVDPARAALAFETARAEFRQQPTVERLAEVQQLCGQVQTALASTPATKDRVRGVDCDPKRAAEAAASLFALNAGSATFAAQCAGGDKLATYTGADALFGFARKCLADSGLPSRDTDALRTKISFTELTRDDRAHRFVVSWNAFSDGNRLAYLALAIAIGIDSLIFMTGLFGANAVRSPLADVPSLKARNSQQLEAVVENALLPDTFGSATLVLEAMHPITPRDGFTAEVIIPHHPTAGTSRVLKVLNAGATIGAVNRDDRRADRYLVRPELFEFLSIVAKKAFDSDKRHVATAELETTLSVALQPDVGGSIDLVLGALEPITPEKGFTAEIRLDEIDPAAVRPSRLVLNAGATADRVRHEGGQHYLVHGELYRSLVRLRARLLSSTAVPQQPQLPQIAQGGERPAVHRGAMNAGRVGQSGALQLETRRGSALDAQQPLDAQFYSRLLETMGFDLNEVAAFKNGNTIGELAAETLGALKAISARHSTLAAYVAAREKEMLKRFNRAYGSFEGRFAEQPAELQALEAASDAIKHMLPALTLHTLVDELVEELERTQSDGRAGSVEQALRDALRQIANAARAMDRYSEADWQELKQYVAELQVVVSNAAPTLAVVTQQRPAKWQS